MILKTTNGGIEWNSLNSGVNQDLLSVQFIDHSTGYAIGRNGTIIKTLNGGNSWLLEDSGINSHLNNIHFSAGNIGYAVGDNGTILMTSIESIPEPATFVLLGFGLIGITGLKIIRRRKK